MLFQTHSRSVWVPLAVLSSYFVHALVFAKYRDPKRFVKVLWRMRCGVSCTHRFFVTFTVFTLGGNDLRTKEETSGITLLGNNATEYTGVKGEASLSHEDSANILEAFDNKHPGNDYFVKFNCPEFTSLCPITGQPDYATIYISYIPDIKMVESKSLKLYLFSYRNRGDFHEDCVNCIMKDLIKLMDPKYIEVWGKFLPRGGISIDPYCNYGRPDTKWEKLAWDRLAWHDMNPEKVDNR